MPLKDDLITLKGNKIVLINPALILENNRTLYLPNSDPKILLENRKYLYGDNEKAIYALKFNKIEKISLLDKGVLANFKGSFIPLQAELIIRLENEELVYEIKPKFSEKLTQKGLISKNISAFALQNNQIKICSKDYCLEKRLLL